MKYKKGDFVLYNQMPMIVFHSHLDEFNDNRYLIHYLKTDGWCLNCFENDLSLITEEEFDAFWVMEKLISH